MLSQVLAWVLGYWLATLPNHKQPWVMQQHSICAWLTSLCTHLFLQRIYVALPVLLSVGCGDHCALPSQLQGLGMHPSAGHCAAAEQGLAQPGSNEQGG
jgi:hypothetical protein